MFAVARSPSPFQNQESIISALEQNCCGVYSRVRSPQPLKVPCFAKNVEGNLSKANEIEATEELQKIISFSPAVDAPTQSFVSLLQPGRVGPTLAPSPSPYESNREEIFEENLPSRSNNPLVLNTPFVMDQEPNPYGAELGLLSPSPPICERESTEAVNMELEAAERKQKRLRSVSCPEGKHLLIQ